MHAVEQLTNILHSSDLDGNNDSVPACDAVKGRALGEGEVCSEEGLLHECQRLSEVFSDGGRRAKSFAIVGCVVVSRQTVRFDTVHLLLRHVYFAWCTFWPLRLFSTLQGITAVYVGTSLAISHPDSPPVVFKASQHPSQEASFALLTF